MNELAGKKLTSLEKQKLISQAAMNMGIINSEGAATQIPGMFDEKNNQTEELLEEEVVPTDQEKEKIMAQHDIRMLKSPDYQAFVMFQNYIRTCRRALSGKEKRNIYRDFLRKAKKGRYNHLFDPEIAKRREERSKAKFDAINAPVPHSVVEIPENVQKEMLDMEEKWDASTADIEK